MLRHGGLKPSWVSQKVGLRATGHNQGKTVEISSQMPLTWAFFLQIPDIVKKGTGNSYPCIKWYIWKGP